MLWNTVTISPSCIFDIVTSTELKYPGMKNVNKTNFPFPKYKPSSLSLSKYTKNSVNTCEHLLQSLKIRKYNQLTIESRIAEFESSDILDDHLLLQCKTTTSKSTWTLSLIPWYLFKLIYVPDSSLGFLFSCKSLN